MVFSQIVGQCCHNLKRVIQETGVSEVLKCWYGHGCTMFEIFSVQGMYIETRIADPRKGLVISMLLSFDLVLKPLKQVEIGNLDLHRHDKQAKHRFRFSM